MSAAMNCRYQADRVLLLGIVLGHLWLGSPGTASGAEIVLESIEPTQQNTAFGLTNEDYWRISQTLLGVQRVVPIRKMPGIARQGEREQDIQLVGTTAELEKVDELTMEQGRFLTSQDSNDRNNVAVLGPILARRLFAMDSPIGRNIRVGEHYFTVVGVLEGPAKLVPRQEKSIYIPLTTMQSRYGDYLVRTKAGMFEQHYYELSQIRIVPKDSDNIEPMMKLLRSLLQKAHERKDYSLRRVDKPADHSPDKPDRQGVDDGR